MSFSGDFNVYLYEISVEPDPLDDPYIKHKVLKKCEKELELMLGVYAISGLNVFALTELYEDIKFDYWMKSQQYSIFIKASSKTVFSSDKISDLKNKDVSMGSTLINIIIKEAFRRTDLTQIGKSPKFFDKDNALQFKNMPVMMCSGFKATAWNYEIGPILVLDNIHKFLSTQSCLERIYQIQERCQ